MSTFRLRSSKYDQIPLLTISQKVGEVVASFIDISLRYDQLRNPQIYAVYVSPIVDAIKADYLSEGIFYCLFANKLHFAKQAKLDVPMSQVWSTRALVCELLATKLISAFTYENTAQTLVFEFYPLADGQLQLVADVPIQLRSSALELAVYSKSKRFLAHPALVKLVDDLWNGRLVYDLLVYRSERMSMQSRDGMGELLGSLRGVICEYDQNVSRFIRLSRLRVPKYRHMMKFFSTLVLVYLYFSLRTRITLRLSARELIFSLWTFGTCLEEIQCLIHAGRKIYFQTLWSTCDFLTTCLLLCYWTLRATALIRQSQEINDIASDFFATLGVTLFPRLFCALEASEGFSRTVIGIQTMSIELFYCWISLMFFSFGFWASLSRFAGDFFTSSEVFYNLFQILFGFTPAVWGTWKKYSYLGRVVLFLYLFMAQFVVMTIVIAALSAKYSEIMAMSREEHHFSRTLQLLVKTKSERAMIFCYTEPFNILALLLKPLQYILPVGIYLDVHRLTLKISHAPILLAIYIYERLSFAIDERQRERKIDQIVEIREQVKQTRRESAHLAHKSNSRGLTRNQTIGKKRNHSHRLTKTTSLDLIQGVLSFESHDSGFGRGGLPYNSGANSRGWLGPPDIHPHEAGRLALDAAYQDDPQPGPSRTRLGVNEPEESDSSRDTIRMSHVAQPQLNLSKMRSTVGPRPRNRVDSIVSSEDRHFNTLKLSPTRSYSLFRSELRASQNQDGPRSETEAQEPVSLETQLSMLTESHQRLEAMLDLIIERLDMAVESS